MEIFRFFQDSGRRHLGFSKVQICNDLSSLNCIIMPNLVKIALTAAEIWRFFLSFLKMAAVRHLGFVMQVM